jgi:hypothetical protein
MILAVDAVSFRLVVNITENGDVKGLEHVKHLDTDDLFAHFFRNLKAFAQFLQQH